MKKKQLTAILAHGFLIGTKMIRQSPAKINLGLLIKRKRRDGFHDLQSVVLPVPFYDVIEIIPSRSQNQDVRFSHTGETSDIPPNENLCIRAFRLFSKHAEPGSIQMHLHKQIPAGAGLGGGSSNASTVLAMLNELAGHPLSFAKLQKLASELGSDCPLFLHKKPMLMEGRGDILSDIHLELHGYYLCILNPGMAISTAYAYSQITPSRTGLHLMDILREPISTWKDKLVNDFEVPVFREFPAIYYLKESLYAAGAAYASMSGSGASVYGIFEHIPNLSLSLRKKMVWHGYLDPVSDIL